MRQLVFDATSSVFHIYGDDGSHLGHLCEIGNGTVAEYDAQGTMVCQYHDIGPDMSIVDDTGQVAFIHETPAGFTAVVNGHIQDHFVTHVGDHDVIISNGLEGDVHMHDDDTGIRIEP